MELVVSMTMMTFSFNAYSNLLRNKTLSDSFIFIIEKKFKKKRNVYSNPFYLVREKNNKEAFI